MNLRANLRTNLRANLRTNLRTLTHFGTECFSDVVRCFKLAAAAELGTLVEEGDDAILIDTCTVTFHTRVLATAAIDAATASA